MPRISKVEGEGQTTQADAGDQPQMVRLIRPHGFYDENGRHRLWRAGDLVSDPGEIELLINRGAPIDFVE